MNITLDPAEFSEVIESAVDKAINRILGEQLTDGAGNILITKRQTAEACSVSESTIDRWRKDDGLPFVKIDGKILFRPSSVDAWAAEKETK